MSKNLQKGFFWIKTWITPTMVPAYKRISPEKFGCQKKRREWKQRLIGLWQRPYQTSMSILAGGFDNSCLLHCWVNLQSQTLSAILYATLHQMNLEHFKPNTMIEESWTFKNFSLFKTKGWKRSFNCMGEFCLPICTSNRISTRNPGTLTTSN